jgi:wyosine [tRNA(Phe)-imidazoG37] synthetase (radical SAM superfamily)
MSASPYSVSKLAHHPEAIAAFRAGRVPAGPVQIHLMPQNLCNHDCSFCSYRLSNWKNSELFNDREHLAWPLLQQTLREAHAMGTRAIELTGGGEPMIYPQVDALLDLIDELGFDLGIVSNGTAITNARATRTTRGTRRG